jgi:membrane protease YdiL (CAAX protease family)
VIFSEKKIRRINLNKNAILRNLSIFTVVAITCGWFAVWINTKIPSPSPDQSLGLLLWILLPLSAALLLRGLGGDGWKDFGLFFNFKENGKWYALAFWIYPATIALTLIVASVFGAVSFDGFAALGANALISAIALGFAMSLLKNIGEEFAWRGYLTPRFQALGLNNLSNHLLTGLIWGLWHIPYWLFFIGEDLIHKYTNIGTTGFIVLSFLAIFPTAVVYGELRTKTASLWPAYLAHNMTNAISAQLILGGFIKFAPKSQIFFSTGPDGILMIVFFAILGWRLLKKKTDSRP